MYSLGSLPSQRHVTPGSPCCKSPLPVPVIWFQVISQKTLELKNTVFSFSLLTFSLQRTGNVKIQSRWPCPIESRGGGNLYTEMITKSYIINSGELTGFGHWPSPHPTIKCPTPRTFLRGMLAFASVTCCPFLWMWQSAGGKPCFSPALPVSKPKSGLPDFLCTSGTNVRLLPII